MKAVREAFEAARLDPGRLDDALELAEAFLAARPGHLVAMAYQGSLHAMKAGAAPLPWDKMRHANHAMALLDEAFEGRLAIPLADGVDRPPDLEILLLRGIAYANFPAFLGRARAARLCLEAARTHPGFAAVPVAYRALACAHLAVLCHRERDPDRASDLLDLALKAHAPSASLVWAAR